MQTKTTGAKPAAKPCSRLIDLGNGVEIPVNLAKELGFETNFLNS
jgi:hypothetical protein